MPENIVGQERILGDAKKYLNALVQGYPQRSVIYYGLRGSGKTVLLNQIEKLVDENVILMEYIEITQKDDFIKQITNSSNKFIQKMSDTEYVANEEESVDLTDLFVSMGKIAEKTGYAICFFLDEIQYMKETEIEVLVDAIHRCNQLRLPIMIFGAGLPKILKMLGEVKSYSERLFKFEEIV